MSLQLISRYFVYSFTNQYLFCYLVVFVVFVVVVVVVVVFVVVFVVFVVFVVAVCFFFFCCATTIYYQQRVYIGRVGISCDQCVKIGRIGENCGDYALSKEAGSRKSLWVHFLIYTQVR